MRYYTRYFRDAMCWRVFFTVYTLGILNCPRLCAEKLVIMRRSLIIVLSVANHRSQTYTAPQQEK